MSRLAAHLGPFYERIRGDIFEFCKALNYLPTHQQRLVLNAVQRAQRGRGKRQIACKSGQGPGKTRLSVVVALWRALQFKDSLVIVTAPTKRQLSELWLGEARRLLGQADPVLRKLVEITESKIIIAGRRDWGIRVETASSAEAFQGRHETHLTYICDEASGVDRSIIEVIIGTLKNEDHLFLMIGNPNTRECAFFDCFNSQQEFWHTITLNAEETPKSAWFDPATNEKIAAVFGRESDVYRVRVKGEFPKSDPNCVMSSEDLHACSRNRMLDFVRVPRWVGQPHSAPARQFGIDLARFGSDESVIARRSGNALVELEFYAKQEPSTVVDRAFRMQLEAGWKDKETWFVPDAGGLGQGVMSKFHDARKQTLEFHSNGVAGVSMFDNRITEAYFGFAKLASARSCYIPADNRLILQLSTRQYKITKDGKIALESKDEYKRRGHDSPDRADAVVLAFYDSVTIHGQSARAPEAKRIGARVA